MNDVARYGGGAAMTPITRPRGYDPTSVVVWQTRSPGWGYQVWVQATELATGVCREVVAPLTTDDPEAVRGVINILVAELEAAAT